jgi:hypothetical protein
MTGGCPESINTNEAELTVRKVYTPWSKSKRDKMSKARRNFREIITKRKRRMSIRQESFYVKE